KPRDPFSVSRRPALSLPPAGPQILDFLGSPLAIEAPGPLPRVDGLPPLRPFDQQSGLSPATTRAHDNPLDPAFAAHHLPPRAGPRVSGIRVGLAQGCQCRNPAGGRPSRATPVEQPRGRADSPSSEMIGEQTANKAAGPNEGRRLP